MATTPIEIAQLEQRIETLEAKNAFQEDVIEQLNKEIAIHQASIAELKENMQFIAKRVKDMAPTNLVKAEDEPPPPHY
ncbi:SlyX family protein [Thalassotalea sp. M1531]|uniref:Protein SlyX homolog n=1 Tax=Thalassotalea algicola TaxID=2716224 RepID=A0A7Y0Q6W3_9GAMM|nr:SlyX family protein [Thalassotalea algicola]NMP30410.1 SlyX family protein [Thalassotalea algicola]